MPNSVCPNHFTINFYDLQRSVKTTARAHECASPRAVVRPSTEGNAPYAVLPGNTPLPSSILFCSVLFSPSHHLSLAPSLTQTGSALSHNAT